MGRRIIGDRPALIFVLLLGGAHVSQMIWRSLDRYNFFSVSLHECFIIMLIATSPHNTLYFNGVFHVFCMHVTLPKCRLFSEVDDHAIFFYLQLLSLVGNTWLQCCFSGPLSRYFLVGHWIVCLLSFLLLQCSCIVLCFITSDCSRYCNFLVFNGHTISLLFPILLNTSSLVILSVHGINPYYQYSAIYPHLKGIKSGQQ